MIDPTNHLGLALFVAKRMACHYNRPIEDFAGAAYIGLADAARRFDPSLGWQFSTFAVPRIRGEILDSMRRERWYGRREDGEEAIEVPLEEARRVRREPAAVRAAIENDRVRVVRGAVARLPKLHREIIELIDKPYGSQVEFAKARGYSQDHISIIKADALAMLRVMLAPIAMDLAS